MKKPSFKFKSLTEADLPMLADWLSRAHLQKWWREEEITIERIRDKYLPRIFGEDDARPYLVYLDNSPVGYIQFYHAWINQAWWPDKPEKGVLGIDQFIAEENNLGKGIGSRFIAEFVKQLFENPEITEVRVDPKPDNERAIRCYKKVGFKKAGQINTPDGPAMMMVLKRKTFLGKYQ
ncbi:GNAT family N-acetyltransferase [Balneolaceae bacterium YR4-1]|uniref:GNAT family N-acetyltransferase n=1 Tax=Halalkalibaculum roseum TaxID=2709311 RepID=A0A6M1SSD8_9BACT|nr:GNAT family N-acetyltransferase [Halalkalibaculum roseum]NGP75096.1 GNAT family N-acetyltransferase [Halalkalibaculum roseum]